MSYQDAVFTTLLTYLRTYVFEISMEFANQSMTWHGEINPGSPLLQREFTMGYHVGMHSMVSPPLYGGLVCFTACDVREVRSTQDHHNTMHNVMRSVRDHHTGVHRQHGITFTPSGTTRTQRNIQTLKTSPKGLIYS